MGRKDWLSGNTLDSCSGGARFESRVGRQLFWLRVLWFSSVPPRKFRDSGSIRLRPLPSRSFSNYHESIYPFDATYSSCWKRSYKLPIKYIQADGDGAFRFTKVDFFFSLSLVRKECCTLGRLKITEVLGGPLDFISCCLAILIRCPIGAKIFLKRSGVKILM
jgi:hypothetical protein